MNGVHIDGRPISVRVGGVTLYGELGIPTGANGVIVFAHGSGSSRLSPRNRIVAESLRGERFATLLFDLLTPEETASEHYTRRFSFEIGRQAERLAGITEWLVSARETRGLRIGYFGASTGAAAALIAAASRPGLNHVGAIVCRGGRPDLAGKSVGAVTAPTLLIVGGADPSVLKLNRTALAALKCEKKLVIVPEATHLFEEAGALTEVARHSAEWFNHYLGEARPQSEGGVH